MRLPSIVSAAVVFAATTSGCFESDLERRSVIQQWRVLTIVADPPTASLDDTVTFQALAVDPDGLRAYPGAADDPADPDDPTDVRGDVQFRWAICARPERVPGLSGLQFEPESMSQACGGSMAVTPSDAEGAPLRVDERGVATLAVPAFVRLLADAAGLDPERPPEEIIASLIEPFAELLEVPPSIVETVVDEVGFPFVVELRMSQGGELRVTAFKRFLLTRSGEIVNRNPDPPRLTIDDVAYEASDRYDFECLPTDGTRATVSPGSQIVLDPQDVFLSAEGECPEGQQCWVDAYKVFDLSGTIIEAEERAYYSWYGTDGRLDQERTLAPADEELWTAPAETGDYPIWMVVRDGHGGTSACRATVRVE